MAGTIQTIVYNESYELQYDNDAGVLFTLELAKYAVPSTRVRTLFFYVCYLDTFTNFPDSSFCCCLED
jgi:hypothetical protein